MLALGSKTNLGGDAKPKRHIDCDPQYEGYAFLYFSNRVENIYLAASNGNNALSFTELNNAQPILESTDGDGDGGSFGSRYLEIWKSNDLITFSAQRHVLVSLDNYGNTWAPEVYYDEDLDTYVVYWASGIYNNTANPKHDPIEYQRMVYATTEDFQTFSKPKIWQDKSPKGRIDSTVIKENDTEVKAPTYGPPPTFGPPQRTWS
ncbi:hypothetical protein CSAL01_13318, partial [Colletotrichum salicis]